MLNARAAAGALALAALATACRGDGTGPTAKPTCAEPTAPAPLVDATTRPGMIDVTVAGAESFHHRQEGIPLRIVVAAAPRIPENVRLLSVGMEAPFSLPDARGFRVALDLVGYTCDGTYRFGAGGSSGATPAPPQSNAFVDVFTPPGARKAIRFDRVEGPCVVDVQRRGRAGRFSCSKLVEATGRVVSLTMDWSTG